MIRFLDKSKTPLCGFDDERNLYIETTLNFNDKKLTLEADWQTIRDFAVVEGYIETKSDRFVIKEIKHDTERSATVIAMLDLEALEAKFFSQFEMIEATAYNILNTAFAATGWTVVCDISKKRTIRLTKCNALDILKSVLTTFILECEIDSKAQTVTLSEHIGEERGVYITTGLNLKQLSVTESTYDYYTEIEPVGKDGLTIAEVNNNQTFLTNYTYSSKQKRYFWKDERYTVAQSLKDDAQAKLADMATPRVSFSAEVRDLAAMSDAYSVLDFGIGDTVILSDPKTGTRSEQRIVTIVKYPKHPEDNTVTLANRAATFDELSAKYEAAAQTVENITTDNGTIDGDVVDAIDSDKVTGLSDAVQDVIEHAEIIDLETRTLSVSEALTAAFADIGTLYGNDATFNTLRTNDLEAINGHFGTLDAAVFTAGVSRIGILEADYANIASLLSGNVGTGQLQAITLNAQNATIDTAFLKNLLAQNITVNDLKAGNINTALFTVGTDDGQFQISGKNLQIKDGSGTVRIQIGQDAGGDFTFVLYDDTQAHGVLINADGIQSADAIADHLIVNDHVANGANISGSKLDIDSVITEINENGTETLSYNRIFFDDDDKTLKQIYQEITTGISGATDAASSAASMAETASANANKAIQAIEGISSLDNLTAILSNDAHSVHTLSDGNGGDYTTCATKITAFKGDMDITDQCIIVVNPSASVTGTWDATTHTYQVTAMSSDNGTVDFGVSYGIGSAHLAFPDGDVLVMPDGNYLALPTAASITKRFSISKSRDGRVGVSYKLQASINVIRRNLDGTLNPPAVRFSGTQSDGSGVSSFAGIFKIWISADGSTWGNPKYTSAEEETSVLYSPPTNTRFIKASLFDDNIELDSQTVTIIADSDELADKITEAEESIATIEESITEINTGITGIEGRLHDAETALVGISDGTLLYQSPYEINGDSVTFTARVYKAGQLITEDFPESWFSWYRRTEDGDVKLGEGYTMTTTRSGMGYGGVIIGRFETFAEGALVMPDGNYVILPDGNRLMVYTAA